VAVVIAVEVASRMAVLAQATRPIVVESGYELWLAVKE
jgi:hypothetical protein